MAKKNKKSVVGFIVIIAIAASVFASFAFFNKTSMDVVNLALRTDNKVYLFSNLGSIAVQMSLKIKQSPVTMNYLRLFQHDKEIYITPTDLKDVAQLLGGDYKLHPYQEQSHDGYVTAGDGSVYTLAIQSETTAQIGERMIVNEITISHPKTGQKTKIVWHRNAKTGQATAVANCQLKSFWLRSSAYPGKYVVTAQDFIVVNLKNVARLFGKNVTLDYVAKDQILYIQR